jgi:hypothetical protein
LLDQFKRYFCVEILFESTPIVRVWRVPRQPAKSIPPLWGERLELLLQRLTWWKEDDDETLFTSVVYIIGMRLRVVSIMRCPWIQSINKIANEYVWFRRT